VSGERRGRSLYSSREVLLLAGILLLATVLRVGWPRLTEFKFSEARLEALALEVTREGRLPLIGVPSSGNFDHSPLSVYLYVPAFIGTTNPIPATIYGGLVGTAAVALCWWAGRRWSGGGSWAAGSAALLLAVNPWAVAFSRKIWQITFVPLLSLAVVVLLLSALVGQSNEERRRPWNLAWGLASYAVLVQVHPSAISLAPALLLWLVVFWRQVHPGPLLAGAALGALTAIPFLVHQVQAGWPLLGALGNLPAATWDPEALQLAWEVVTGRGIQVLAGAAQPDLEAVPLLSRTFGLVGWLVLVSVVVLAWRTVRGWRSSAAGQRRAARVDLVLLTWLLAPVVFNLQHSLDLHLHFFALILPAAFLVAGRGTESLLDELLGATHTSMVRWGATAVLGIVATVQVVVLVLLARFVATHTTPEGFGTPLGVYLEAADRAAEAAGTGQVLVVGIGDSPVVNEGPAIFDVLLRGHVAYRFVDGQSATVFPAGASVALLTPTAGRAEIWYDGWPRETIKTDYPETYKLVRLDGAWPSAGLTEIQGPRLFQNGVELQAYRWQTSIGSGAVMGGELWLLWQVLWQETADTHFSIRMLDEGQVEWGRQDGPGYPPGARQKGDRILSLFYIKPGYRITSFHGWAQIGLYTFPDVVPVPVIDQAGNPVSDAILLPVENW
jgi:hypothetical protein